MTQIILDAKKFKVKYYFNLYKDFPSASRDNFRIMFHKKHERALSYEELNELLAQINQYQINRYGRTLDFPKERR